MSEDLGVRNAVRFVAAVLAMAGRLAAGVPVRDEKDQQALAQQAVGCADALMAELRKQP